MCVYRANGRMSGRETRCAFRIGWACQSSVCLSKFHHPSTILSNLRMLRDSSSIARTEGSKRGRNMNESWESNQRVESSNRVYSPIQIFLVIDVGDDWISWHKVARFKWHRIVFTKVRRLRCIAAPSYDDKKWAPPPPRPRFVRTLIRPVSNLPPPTVSTGAQVASPAVRLKDVSWFQPAKQWKISASHTHKESCGYNFR